MRRAIYPGTFDPMTLGHLDIVARARRTFDEVVVVLAVNPDKSPLFPLGERLRLTRECVAGLDGVRVDCWRTTPNAPTPRPSCADCGPSATSTSNSRWPS